jgi:formate/nitrite transporter FocA (FNT family)
MALLFSGLAAGLSMGFSLQSQRFLHARLLDAPWREFVASLAYTVRFLIVDFGRQLRFAENTLTPILPFLHNREPRMLMNVLRLWSAVFAANMRGACVFAFVVAKNGLFGGPDTAALLDVSRKAMGDPFMTMLTKAVLRAD